MRRIALPLGLVALLVAVAADAAPRRTILSPAPVATLAADGPYVAFAATSSARDCDRVRVWNRATGRVVRIGRVTSCAVTSTGHGVSRVAVARHRVLWLQYGGGNIREYQIFTATTTAPRPRRVAFGAADVDAPPPMVVGPGDASRFGDLLPFAVGPQVIAISSSGARVFEWTSPRRVTALGAGAGGLAVGLSDGRVLGFDGTGDATPDVEWSGAPAAAAVFVTGDGVVAQRGDRVELRTGAGAVRVFSIPARARLTDAEGSRAVYVDRGAVRLLDLATGTARTVARGVSAELESGLVYAAGRRLTVVPPGRLG